LANLDPVAGLIASAEVAANRAVTVGNGADAHPSIAGGLIAVA
jgi:hypothetical protein